MSEHSSQKDKKSCTCREPHTESMCLLREGHNDINKHNVFDSMGNYTALHYTEEMYNGVLIQIWWNPESGFKQALVKETGEVFNI
jgi:hypothetical protein